MGLQHGLRSLRGAAEETFRQPGLQHVTTGIRDLHAFANESRPPTRQERLCNPAIQLLFVYRAGTAGEHLQHLHLAVGRFVVLHDRFDRKRESRAARPAGTRKSA